MIGQKISIRFFIRTSINPLDTLAFFSVNLSFAQVEASYVLLLGDYWEFGATETGRLFTYIGVCVILAQSALINLAVRRFGKVETVQLGTNLLLIGQALTVLMSLCYRVGSNHPSAQTIITTTLVCFGLI